MNRRRQSKTRTIVRRTVSFAGKAKWAGAQPEKKYAEGYIRGLQREFPEKSLIQLLPWVAAHNQLAAEMLVERIERNQGEKLSPEDKVFLQQVKARLAGQMDCSAC
jgi:hypothetical protein